MEENILVSVIVPIYNTEQYVEHTIQDICNQTYTNIEIILVDDGSTDNSGQICEDYKKQDYRIKVIHTINRGLSAARNIGICNSMGKYIYFLDSDDRIHQRTIQILLDEAIHNKCEIVQTSGIDFNDDSIVDDLNQRDIEEYTVQIFDKREMCYGMFERRIVAAEIVQNKLYLRTLFSETVRFKEGRIHEDTAITYMLFWQCERIGCIDAELFCYRRRRPGSIINGSYSVKRLDVLIAENERCEFFKEKKEKILYQQALKCKLNSAISCVYSLKKSSIPEKEKYISDICKNNFKGLYIVIFAKHIRLKSKMRIIMGVVRCLLISMKF